MSGNIFNDPRLNYERWRKTSLMERPWTPWRFKGYNLVVVLRTLLQEPGDVWDLGRQRELRLVRRLPTLPHVNP